jgi:hypothetical protein
LATKDSTCAISTRSRWDVPSGRHLPANIDNGDLLTDVALSYVFRSRRTAGRLSAYPPKGRSRARSKRSGRSSHAEVSFGPKPNIVKAGDYTFFAGSRSDAFFSISTYQELFDIRGKRNFTEPHLTGKSPTGVI